jgi:hypothetical protein
MIGSFDHLTLEVSKPVVVYDKMGVNKPDSNTLVFEILEKLMIR